MRARETRKRNRIIYNIHTYIYVHRYMYNADAAKMCVRGSTGHWPCSTFQVPFRSSSIVRSVCICAVYIGIAYIVHFHVSGFTRHVLYAHVNINIVILYWACVLLFIYINVPRVEPRKVTCGTKRWKSQQRPKEYSKNFEFFCQILMLIFKNDWNLELKKFSIKNML